MTSILHISEAFGGGIVMSVSAFARNTSEFQHHLLVAVRENDKIDLQQDTAFASVSNLPSGMFARIRAIRRLTKELDVDFVHLHSSFAGVYGRLAGMPRHKIIYSPHGFAFERASDPKWKRYTYLLAEKILSFRQGGFVGVSPYEAKRAREMNPRQRIFFVPNSYTNTLQAMRSKPHKAGKTRLTCVGRLSPQKDPEFLLSALKALPREIRTGFDITWVGGGDKAQEDALQKQGVNVLGWVQPDVVEQVLQETDLYVHTAAWEGFPMSIIEASVAGSPILVRIISSYEGIEFSKNASIKTHEQLRDAMIAIHENTFDWDAAVENAMKVRKMCAREEQRKILLKAYSCSQGFC